VDEALRLRASAAARARDRIRSGALRGHALRQLLLDVPSRDRDPFVDELLGVGEAPPDDPGLPRGSVPYLPCGVDEILAMVAEVPVGPEDELVDLGSGLGRVVILGHLLSGARARGVEIQRALVDASRACAADLALDQVSFTHESAVDTELDGSVVFLYAPFNGPTLARVLRRLEEHGKRTRRRLVVCTVGLELPDESWLERRPSSCPALAIYVSA
jgi:hypothetical protein